MTTIGAKVKSCFLLSVIENLPLNPLWKTMNTPKIIGAKTTPKTMLVGAGLLKNVGILPMIGIFAFGSQNL